MDRHIDDLQKKLAWLLTEAAQVSVALDRANGTIHGVPHYSVIELRAHQPGQDLEWGTMARHLKKVKREIRIIRQDSRLTTQFHGNSQTIHLKCLATPHRSVGLRRR